MIAFYSDKPLPDSDDRTRCMDQICEGLFALKAARGDNWSDPMKAMPDEVRDIYDSATVGHFELADEYQASQD